MPARTGRSSSVVRIFGLGALVLLVVAVVWVAIPATPRTSITKRAEDRVDSVIAEIAAVSPEVGEGLKPYEELLDPVAAVTRALPPDPLQALTTAVKTLSEAIGFPQDPGPAIRAAAIPPDVAGRLALLLGEMYPCSAITAKYKDLLFQQMPSLFRNRSGLNATDFPYVLPCAGRMWTATGELELTLTAALGPPDSTGCRSLRSGSVDVWPVLRFEPSCASHTYRNDYLLSVDVGGADTYANNVGSNVVDINYSPPGAAVPGRNGTGPAKGCQRGLNGLGLDDCYLSAAVLLDLQGDDTFGVLEDPDSDSLCTRDPVVRRMLTGGAAFLGVGILRDAGSSNDKYVGKTVSLGAGHMFGVGILSDAGGDDTYLAVRNSQGYALVSGFGLLRDYGGNDTYDYYMPTAIDPTAANQTDGAGGVRDNEGDGVCDHVPRYTLGGANLLSTATGVLIDDAGDDTYHGAFADSYTTTPSIPGMVVTGGSLGYGGNDGLAVFLDRAGHDTYRVDNVPKGLPPRSDGAVILPGTEATGARGTGVFIDKR